MFVLRTTLEAAVKAAQDQSAAERVAFYRQYGEALSRCQALAFQLSAWVMNKAENITPEQAATMFYAQDDKWQAAFFNLMQAQVLAHHAANPSPYSHPGVPAGEGQWYHMAQHLDDSGFETLSAMFENASSHRDPA